MTDKTLKINSPFKKVVELLPQISEVDGVSAGASPITFRWLTEGNVYVNVGLAEVKEFDSPEDEQAGKKPTDEYCELQTNVNSYEVKHETLCEIHARIEDFILGWDKEQAKKLLEEKAKEEAGIADIQARGRANAEAKKAAGG